MSDIFDSGSSFILGSKLAGHLKHFFVSPHFHRPVTRKERDQSLPLLAWDHLPLMREDGALIGDDTVKLRDLLKNSGADILICCGCAFVYGAGFYGKSTSAQVEFLTPHLISHKYNNNLLFADHRLPLHVLMVHLLEGNVHLDDTWQWMFDEGYLQVDHQGRIFETAFPLTEEGKMVTCSPEEEVSRLKSYYGEYSIIGNAPAL